jgi:putative nucleotidyltransferase with HDIG domain
MMPFSVRGNTDLIKTATSIVSRLKKAGFLALFAGGSVRDALLGHSPKDIDIATSATPEEVQKLFNRTVPVGAQFGVVRVLESGFEFEVATFRADGVYLDGRRPTGVKFSTPEQDAQRRDFTMNGIFYDPLTESIIDYVGGQADIERKLIRAIGNPDDRFKEDRLRLMRTVRFSALLQFDIEAQTWEATRKSAPFVTVVSPERIRDELMKILGSPGRVRGFDLLNESGLLAVILPEVERLKGCEQPPQFHPEGDVFVHTRRMLELLPPDADALLAMSVLLHDIGKPPTQSYDLEDDRIRFNGHDRVGAEMAEDVMRRLRFSRHETETVVEAVRNHMVFKDVQRMRPAKLKRFMARSNFDLEMGLHRVDCLSSHGELDNHAFLKDKSEEFSRAPLIPVPLVRGDDLLALGLKPGPRIGELLEAVQTAQLEGDLSSREDALQFLNNLLAKN